MENTAGIPNVRILSIDMLKQMEANERKYVEDSTQLKDAKKQLLATELLELKRQWLKMKKNQTELEGQLDALKDHCCWLNTKRSTLSVELRELEEECQGCDSSYEDMMEQCKHFKDHCRWLEGKKDAVAAELKELGDTSDEVAVASRKRHYIPK